jgi:group I intron endonuclease
MKKKKRKICGIYCIENKINNKKYIGWAFDIDRRWYMHKWNFKHDSHNNTYLANSYKKYGENNFDFYVIQELETETNILNLMEIYWVAYHNSFIDDGGGYNLTRGGDGVGKPSLETRQKMSKSQMGNKKALGKHHTDETKKLISEGHIGIKRSEETKQKVSFSKTGIKTAKSSSSQYVGVRLRSWGSWEASMRIDRKKVYLGSYESEINAAMAYDIKAIQIYGESAKTNFSIDFIKNNEKNIIRNIVNSEKARQKMALTSGGVKRGKNASSKYVGVSWNSSKNKWGVSITYMRKGYNLGYFDSEIEAAQIYDIKSIELRGPNAKTNFPISPLV